MHQPLPQPFVVAVVVISFGLPPHRLLYKYPLEFVLVCAHARELVLVIVLGFVIVPESQFLWMIFVGH